MSKHGKPILFLGKNGDQTSNYMQVIQRALRLHPERFKGGVVTHVEIQHDDGCAFWKGEACNCNPNVIFGKEPDKTQ